MSNKKERFFKKAFNTLPRLQKEELIQLSRSLITDRAFLMQLINQNSKGVVVYQNRSLIFQSENMTLLFQELPYLVLSPDNTGIIILYDLDQRERCLEIECIEPEKNMEIYYISDLSDSRDNELFQKIDDELQSLETMAAGIAHEIKNPLSAIDIHTQLIQRQIDKKNLQISSEISNYLDIVKIESHRLLNVLDQFLHRVRHNRPTLIFVETADIIEQTLKVFKAVFEQKNISYVSQTDQVPKIFTEPYLLQQIISDLIRNAIEALENVNNKKLSVTLKEDKLKTSLIISVDDSGTGITDSLKKKVFNPYFTTKKNGTGLGLTLIKKMLLEIGGSISLKDSLLGGASFQIFLPISQGQSKLSHKKL